MCVMGKIFLIKEIREKFIFYNSFVSSELYIFSESLMLAFIWLLSERGESKIQLFLSWILETDPHGTAM